MKHPPEKVLSSWKILNAYLAVLEDEDEAWDLLEHEIAHGRRGMFALRIHSRFNKLRATRERIEIIQNLGIDANSMARVATYPDLRHLVNA